MSSVGSGGAGRKGRKPGRGGIGGGRSAAAMLRAPRCARRRAQMTERANGAAERGRAAQQRIFWEGGAELEAVSGETGGVRLYDRA